MNTASGNNAAAIQSLDDRVTASKLEAARWRRQLRLQQRRRPGPRVSPTRQTENRNFVATNRVRKVQLYKLKNSLLLSNYLRAAAHSLWVCCASCQGRLLRRGRVPNVTFESYIESRKQTVPRAQPARTASLPARLEAALASPQKECAGSLLRRGWVPKVAFESNMQ